MISVDRSMQLYIIFCGLFITTVITGNLIFQKFVHIEFLEYAFEISVGVLLYPITFLISDFVTECYGTRYAKFMVEVGVVCSLVVFGLILIADQLQATSWSSVDNATFHRVFHVYGVAAVASVSANYLGQLIDIYVFAYLKALTGGRHLWLRNNVSTILGQAIDTVTVVSILCFVSIIPSSQYWVVILSSLSFKILAALADTPFCYLGYYLIRKFNLAKIA
jgi:hypothetical protein